MLTAMLLALMDHDTPVKLVRKNMIERTGDKALARNQVPFFLKTKLIALQRPLAASGYPQ